MSEPRSDSESESESGSGSGPGPGPGSDTRSDSRLDRSEHLTIGLFVLFCGTLAIVVTLDEPIGWLLWGIAMVAVAGVLLVAVNRSTPVETEA